MSLKSASENLIKCRPAMPSSVNEKEGKKLITDPSMILNAATGLPQFEIKRAQNQIAGSLMIQETE